VVLRELSSGLDSSSNLALRWIKARAQARDSNRWRARGEQQTDEGASAVDGRNMFCLLKTTILFVHASSFILIKNFCNIKAIHITYETTMKLYLVTFFFHCVFYTCLLAVRRASARQVALSYLVLKHCHNCVPTGAKYISISHHWSGKSHGK
jgi:hypothetical protein